MNSSFCSRDNPVLSRSNVGRRLLLIKPCLSHSEHVPVGEHLENLALKAGGLELIRPTEFALAVLDTTLDVEKAKLWATLSPPERLTNGVFLLQE